MSPVVVRVPKYRPEEEKEGRLQGCHVCVVRTKVRGQAALRVVQLVTLSRVLGRMGE